MSEIPSLKRQKLRSTTSFNKLTNSFDSTNEQPQEEENEYPSGLFPDHTNAAPSFPPELSSELLKFIELLEKQEAEKNIGQVIQDDFGGNPNRKTSLRSAARKRISYQEVSITEDEGNITMSTIKEEKQMTEQDDVGEQAISPLQVLSNVANDISQPIPDIKINKTPAEAISLANFNLHYNKSNTPKYNGKFVNIIDENRLKRQCLLCDKKYTDLKGFNRHYEVKHLGLEHRIKKRKAKPKEIKEEDKETKVEANGEASEAGIEELKEGEAKDEAKQVAKQELKTED
ncbi:unnamed protein product [Candida verbasci]|uniref:C2H2-type domain-containing protein n=1 Tax=Candida verbasci TaxID=1227364 RepID=A0A9W4XB27_9ASCO|nr:unnamed protein product [Candida verbasci]